MTEGLGTSAVLALFLVPIVSMIKRPTWSKQAKYLLGMLASLICAAVGALIDGDVKSVSEFVAYAATALAVSQTIYTMYFENSDLEERLRG